MKVMYACWDHTRSVAVTVSSILPTQKRAPPVQLPCRNETVTAAVTLHIHDGDASPECLEVAMARAVARGVQGRQTLANAKWLKQRFLAHGQEPVE